MVTIPLFCSGTALTLVVTRGGNREERLQLVDVGRRWLWRPQRAVGAAGVRAEHWRVVVVAGSEARALRARLSDVPAFSDEVLLGHLKATGGSVISSNDGVRRRDAASVELNGDELRFGRNVVIHGIRPASATSRASIATTVASAAIVAIAALVGLHVLAAVGVCAALTLLEYRVTKPVSLGATVGALVGQPVVAAAFPTFVSAKTNGHIVGAAIATAAMTPLVAALSGRGAAWVRERATTALSPLVALLGGLLAVERPVGYVVMALALGGAVLRDKIAGPRQSTVPIADDARRQRLALGIALGVMYCGWWEAALVAPQVGAGAGVAAGFVGALLIVGLLIGSFLTGVRGLGTTRRRITQIAAVSSAAPLIALADLARWGLLAVVALVTLGIAVDLANGAVTAAVGASEAGRASMRSWSELGLAKVCTIAVGGVLVNTVASSEALFYVTLALVPAVVHVLGVSCPDGPQELAPPSSARAPRLVIVAAFAAGSQSAVSTVFVILALDQAGVEIAGWTQVVLPASLAAVVLSVGGRSDRSAVTRRAMAGVGLSTLGVALSLAVGAGAAAWEAAAVVCVVRFLVLFGVELFNVAALTSIATSHHAIARYRTASMAGQTVFAGVAGLVWARVDEAARAQVIVGSAVALGILGGLAAHRWLAREGSLLDDD